MKKLLFFMTLALSLSAATVVHAQPQEPFSTEPFSDVPASHPHYKAIEFLRENNILKGYPDGTFMPNRRISRGEFVKLVINPFILDTERINECLKSNVSEGSTQVFFPDVNTSDWFAVEVCFAKTKRIIDGYPDGKFRPGGYITFVEVAKILSNVFAFEIQAEDQGEQWYVPYARHITGLRAVPASVRRFDQMMTRGEMAEILFRLKTKNTDLSAQQYSNLK